MYQGSLNFDETYAWVNFIKQVEAAKQGQKFVYYGLANTKLVLVKISQQKVLILTSRLKTQGETHYEGNIRFFEVEVMSKATITKHLHRYERSGAKHKEKKDQQIYRCIDPDCSHYTQARYILGKRAICMECSSPYIIYPQQLKLLNKRLVCELCSKSVKGRALVETTNIIGDILKAVEDNETIQYSSELLDKEDN